METPRPAAVHPRSGPQQRGALSRMQVSLAMGGLEEVAVTARTFS